MIYLFETFMNLKHQQECIIAIKIQNQSAINNWMMMEKGQI